MAMAADSSADSHTPTSAAGLHGAANSPQSRRRKMQSPWAQVVRGVEPESSSFSPPLAAAAVPRSPSSSPAASASAVPRSPSSSPPLTAAVAAIVPEQSPPLETSSAPESQPENSDDGNGNSNGNAARSKKPAWNKPVKGGVVEGASVMGDSVSWPALSELTRSGGKSSSDSLKSEIPDGSTSSSQGVLISQMPPKQQANTNADSNFPANHANTTRPRPGRHQRGAGPPAQGGNFNRPSPPIPPPPPPMPPPFPAIIEMPRYGSFGNFVPPPVLDPPVRGGSRPMSAVGSSDHSTHAQRNTSRRNNFGGGRPRGEYHNHHGGRRDHERRDAHLPHQFVPPPPPPPPPGGFMPAPTPPSPGSAPFIPAPPLRPYVGPIGYDMPPPPPYMYMPSLPYFAPPPSQPMYFPVPPLPALIVRQIDYYFSDDNLVKDEYLKSNMDEEGWVPVSLIASFPRVQKLTVDIPLILESLKASTVVEIKEQGDKIRRRNDWRKYIHASSGQISADSGSSQIPGTSPDDFLANSISKISLNEETSSKGSVLDSPKSETEAARNRPTPEDSIDSSSVLANGDVTPDEELHAN